jgi:hypothetical protein
MNRIHNCPRKNKEPNSDVAAPRAQPFTMMRGNLANTGEACLNSISSENEGLKLHNLRRVQHRGEAAQKGVIGDHVTLSPLLPLWR